MDITFIGLGNMGFAMASHLAKAGHKLTVYNRSQGKSENWIHQHPGHSIAFNAKNATEDCEVLILCVGNDNDVRELVFGKNGAHQTLAKGTLIIDHSTTSATLAKEMHDKLNELQVDYVDAPVSGGQLGAQNGTLVTMCGGDPHPAQRAESICKTYSKEFSHIGPIGSGQLTKMVNQICIAGLIQGLSEAINFGQNAGLDMDKVMKIIAGGAAGSWQMSNRQETMRKDEYDFGFSVNHMRKDLGICLQQAQTLEASLPVTALVDQFYADLQRNNLGHLDTSSLLKRLQK